MIQYITFSLMLLLAISNMSLCDKIVDGEDNSKQTLNNDVADVAQRLRQAERQLARLNAFYYSTRREILNGLKARSDDDDALGEESLERGSSDEDVPRFINAKRSSSDPKQGSVRGSNKRGECFFVIFFSILNT
jgi:hypothetical protein